MQILPTMACSHVGFIQWCWDVGFIQWCWDVEMLALYNDVYTIIVETNKWEMRKECQLHKLLNIFLNDWESMLGQFVHYLLAFSCPFYPGIISKNCKHIDEHNDCRTNMPWLPSFCYIFQKMWPFYSQASIYFQSLNTYNLHLNLILYRSLLCMYVWVSARAMWNVSCIAFLLPEVPVRPVDVSHCV